MSAFVVEEFVEACVDAVSTEDTPHMAIKDIVERAVSDPAAVEATMGDLTELPSFVPLHNSDTLTILHIVWPPGVDLYAHDHNMWATIGLYGGREDNTFYRRLETGMIEDRGTKEMLRGDVVVLGDDTVHAVKNPSSEWTGAFHVYGGDFFRTPRTMWDMDTLQPAPYDHSQAEAVLSNAREAALSL